MSDRSSALRSTRGHTRFDRHTDRALLSSSAIRNRRLFESNSIRLCGAQKLISEFVPDAVLFLSTAVYSPVVELAGYAMQLQLLECLEHRKMKAFVLRRCDAETKAKK